MPVRLAIVVSEFNSGITFRMLDRARDHAGKVDAKISYVLYVPGAFDMPLAVQKLLKKQDVDAVVTLGAVIKGDTRHDDIVAENAARLLYFGGEAFFEMLRREQWTQRVGGSPAPGRRPRRNRLFSTRRVIVEKSVFRPPL